MAEVVTMPDDARRGVASDWLARLSATDLDAAEAARFDAWVSEPANGRAYAAALSVMLELQAAAPEVLEGLNQRPTTSRRTNLRRAWFAIGGLAAAAAIA